MSESAVDVLPEVPTFSECVVGYRAWVIDPEYRLWPASDHRAPWVPGVNTARGNCRVHGALSFDWSKRDGRRVLEPRPQHVAPDVDCTCGLYSWRRPRPRWKDAARLQHGQMVCGAAASWGRLMVHRDGFRAEHACVVTLAYPPGTELVAMDKLRHVAEQYRVDLVALDQLEEAASRHGSPVPDTVGPETAPDADPRSRHRTRPTRAPRDEHAASSRSLRSRAAPPPGLESISTKDRIGLALMLAFALIGYAGGAMWFGHGATAKVGLGMWVGSAVGFLCLMWWLQPHRAAKRVHANALHRLRNWRERRGEPVRETGGHMTDAEFEAIEDALEPLYRHGSDMSNSFDPYRGLQSPGPPPPV